MMGSRSSPSVQALRTSGTGAPVNAAIPSWIVVLIAVAAASARTVMPVTAQSGTGSQGIRVGGAVAPSVIYVGDVFQAAIRVNAPAGSEVSFPDTLAVPEDVEAAGRRQVVIDTLDSQVWRYTASYPLTAWRPDSVLLPASEVEVGTAGGGTATLRVPFERFTVQSVLPADTSGIEPRAARDVLGANRVWWPLLLLALVLGLLVSAAVYFWRRRKEPVVVAPVVHVSPRERALERIDEALAAGLIEAGRMREFYTLIADAVRGYTADLESGWGCDLTTTELRARMRRTVPEAASADLFTVLRSADMIKFARGDSDRETALGRGRLARDWVERFDGPRLPLERAA